MQQAIRLWMSVRAIAAGAAAALCLVGSAGADEAEEVASPVPAPAAAVGYTSLSFDSTAVRSKPGSWYPWEGFYALPTTPARAYTQNPDGSLTINGDATGAGSFNANLTTGRRDPSQPHAFQGLAFGCGADFHMVFSVSPSAPFNNNPGAPLWLSPIERMAAVFVPPWSFPGAHYLFPGQGSARGPAAGYADWTEVDGVEFYFHSTDSWKGNTTIEWVGTGNGRLTQNSQHRDNVQAPLHSGQRQTVDLLWVPATASAPGYLAEYVDGELLGTPTRWHPFSWEAYGEDRTPMPRVLDRGASPGNFMSIIDQEHLMVLTGASAPAGAFTIHAMQVWQGPAACNWNR